ncbi:phage holin family protein [Corallococcus sp. H22C18031201]|uniref:phage holin family protein n=1 Tax=Citreicoccus inhibens TaxID=2849499 RepID=UPI000E70F72E|nr:phage holin family protein [Citreicoccus inhibens]MBU8900555.1 phage holin family protein [Citreicoccus inhibens]RJS26917.1 phage holin family protein [Corallococcus sp. H22C18031201]
MHVGSEQTERGITALVGRMAEGFSRLVSQHLQLARLELSEDARAMGLDVARIAVFVPFILVGYAFVCGGLAAAMVPWTGWAGALAVVGLLNLVGGGLGVAHAVARLKARQMMDDTSDELSRSMAVFTRAPARPAPAESGVNTLRESSPSPFQEPPHGR